MTKLENRKTIVEKISFQEVVKSITEDINQRAKDILAGRFGFESENIKTLSQIGDEYGITRERVRQIIQESLIKVRRKAKEDRLFKMAEERLKFTLADNYGIIHADRLISEVRSDDENGNLIKFILFCSDELEHLANHEEIEEVAILAGFELKRVQNTYTVTEEILKKEKKVFVSDDIFGKFLEKEVLGLEKDEFFNILSVSKKIKQNVFGKWGLRDWQEIQPKGVREKAYLIFQEMQKPLHFKEVADLIYEYGLNKKNTHPQTVHNELIRDDKFVLVGRGIYALSEWGYEKGTVREVIENILKEQKSPLHRNEIVEKVLSVRNVKPATVVINLNNFFEKVDERRYFLKKQ